MSICIWRGQNHKKRQNSRRLLRCKGLLFSAAITIGLLSHSVCAESDNNGWLAVTKKLYQSGAHSLSLYVEGRATDDIGEVTSIFGGPLYRYRQNEHVTWGAAYKQIAVKRGDHFDDLRRFEGEVTFSGNVFDSYKVDLRNRLEIINESGKDNSERVRHRFRVRKPVDFGPLSRVFVSNEIFYTVDSGNFRLQQNRFVPVGLTFNIGEKKTVDVFYMLLHRNEKDGSTNNHHVIGIYFNL